VSRWFILRTRGGRTLALMASLREAGFDVWTPARTLRRNIRAATPSGTRLIETEVPILPTFLFAREQDLDALVDAAAQEPSPHPDFSVFRYAGKIPLVSDGSVAGLREEELRNAAMIQAMRAAETHAEAERIRIASIKSEGARRRAEQANERDRRNALRAQGSTLSAGDDVEVIEMPALVGVTGVLESTDGTFAHVRFGTHSWKVDGWRVMPATSDDHTAPRSLAA
jgi:hypothetical protein